MGNMLIFMYNNFQQLLCKILSENPPVMNSSMQMRLDRLQDIKQDSIVPMHTIFLMASFTIFQDLRNKTMNLIIFYNVSLEVTGEDTLPNCLTSALQCYS